MARMRQSPERLAALVAALFFSLPAAAGGKLLATGGATQIEGSAGGGIVPWAVLAGYGTRDEIGCAASAIRVESQDYGLYTFGAACSFANRLELSLTRQTLDLDGLRPVLGLPDDQMLRQQVVGAKLRLAGDLVYRPWGQWSVGVMRKHALDESLARAAGAARTEDTDYYLAGSRLFLYGPAGRMLLLNTTVRWTRANQTGLLGFGGDRRGARSLNFELAAAWFIRRDLALGLEYREKPDNLRFAAEDDWGDAFAAWFPTRHLSVVAAWAELGDIGGLGGQRGPFLSLQGSF